MLCLLPSLWYLHQGTEMQRCLLLHLPSFSRVFTPSHRHAATTLISKGIYTYGGSQKDWIYAASALISKGVYTRDA